MGTWAQDRGDGFALMLDETGALAFLRRHRRLDARAPHRSALVPRGGGGRPGGGDGDAAPDAAGRPRAEPRAAGGRDGDARATPAPPADFFLGAAHQAIEDGRLRTTWHFNGKIDGPSLARRALTPDELEAAATAPAPRRRRRTRSGCGISPPTWAPIA